MGRSRVDIAFARAARLVHAGDDGCAVRTATAALTAAPPRNVGRQLAIEPLLRAHRAPDTWAHARALLHLRAR